VSQRRFEEAGNHYLHELPATLTAVSRLSPRASRAALNAAICYERCGHVDRAVSLFINLGQVERAVELLRRSGRRSDAGLVKRGRGIAGSPWPLGSLSSTLPKEHYETEARSVRRSTPPAPVPRPARAGLVPTLSPPPPPESPASPAPPSHEEWLAGPSDEAPADRWYSEPEESDPFLASPEEVTLNPDGTGGTGEDWMSGMASDGLLDSGEEPDLEISVDSSVDVSVDKSMGDLGVSEEDEHWLATALGEAPRARTAEQTTAKLPARTLERSLPRPAPAPPPPPPDELRPPRDEDDESWARRTDEEEEKLARRLRDLSAEIGLGPLDQGEVINDRYRLEGPLGEGGYAVVFRAMDLELEEPVAIKLFNKKAYDETSVARIKEEIRISRRLSHPNIVGSYEFGQWGTAYFITMELMRGLDLSGYVKRCGGRLPLSRAVHLLIQGFEGLGHAHSKNIIHRDIKPQNLFVVDRGETLKVMDFGIARAADSANLTKTGRVVGTPAYISPERLKRGFRDLSPATDIYSMGVVLYRVLTGMLPFDDPDIASLFMSILKESPAMPSSLDSDLPIEVDELILRLMAKDPLKRPGTCAEVIELLGALPLE
jgi:tRNA A-37 threonylcarbamoyl transferase component Bud32